MPLLLGTAPNQVPTNGDLGTMAFQDQAAVNIQGGSVAATTLSSSSSVSGTGFSNYLASPPAIGVTAPNTLKGTVVTTTTNFTFPDASTQNTAATGFGFKNRIINGDMRIDQRNAGAAITNIAGVLYDVDRFWTYGSQASKYTAQQNAGAVTPPVGFTKYLGVTSLSAYTVGTSEFFSLYQSIEGFNTADLAWGTVNAATVTMSFWVRSSLTGTFGGSLLNEASNRSYTYSYTINVANTWEQKFITIVGDTTGTWATGNTCGIFVGFNLGSGATVSGTAGAWAATAYRAPTGATSVVGTSGATFYITGVQLEKGSTATSFDFRPYGTELALCQRYLPAFTFTAGNQNIGGGFCYGAGAAFISVPFPVSTRVPPTGVSVTGTFNTFTSNGGNSGNFTSVAFFQATNIQATINCTGGSALVAGNGTILLSPSGSSQIQFTGCEL